MAPFIFLDPSPFLSPFSFFLFRNTLVFSKLLFFSPDYILTTMADVTAPSVQTNLTPADAAAVTPITAAPVHDQQTGPSVSPPQVTFPDETKNNITPDLRAKALKADAAAQAARDPNHAVLKKLDELLDLAHEILEVVSSEEPTEEDNEFVADDDEEEVEGDDDEEEDEAIETAEEDEGDDVTSTKRTADDMDAETPAAQRRKTRRH